MCQRRFKSFSINLESKAGIGLCCHCQIKPLCLSDALCLGEVWVFFLSSVQTKAKLFQAKWWVVVQRPSDGANSRVTSRHIAASLCYFIALAGAHKQWVAPAPRAAEPGKKVPAPGSGPGHLWQDTERNRELLPGRGTLITTSQNSAFRPRLLQLCVCVLESSMPSTHASSYCAGTEGRRGIGLPGG